MSKKDKIKPFSIPSEKDTFKRDMQKDKEVMSPENRKKLEDAVKRFKDKQK